MYFLSDSEEEDEEISLLKSQNYLNKLRHKVSPTKKKTPEKNTQTTKNDTLLPPRRLDSPKKYQKSTENWSKEFNWLKQGLYPKECTRCNYCGEYVIYDYNSLKLHEQSEFHKKSLIQDHEDYVLLKPIQSEEYGNKTPKPNKDFVLLKSTHLIQNCCICKENINALETYDIKDILVSKSMKSKRLLVEILGEIIGNKLLLNQRENYCVCDNCLLKLDEYDEAYTKMVETKENLLKLLEKTCSSTDKNLEQHINCETESSIKDLDVKDYHNDDDYDSDEPSNIEKSVLPTEIERQCDLCGKVFRSRRSYTAHKKTHTTLKCYMCNKKYKSKHCYLSHIALHNDIALHQCKICSKVLPSKYMLKIHHRKHLDEGPYKCEVCEKGFRDVSLLIAHSATHLSRGFQCHICGNCYKVRKSLREHLKNTHGRDKINETKNGQTNEEQKISSFEIKIEKLM